MSTTSKTFFKPCFDIKEIPFDKYDKDFTFIVNGEEYPTLRILADMLSPKIRQLHLIDKTIDTFTINTKVKCDFNDIISLVLSDETQIDNEQQLNYCDIFLQLGNKEAYLQLIPKCDENITLHNAFDFVDEKILYVSSFNNSMHSNEIPLNHEILQTEIDFIANHFYDVDLEKLKKYDESIIEWIIGNSNLHLTDEDSLLNFVIDLYSNDNKLSYLFNYIDFLNVSDEEMRHFHQIFDLNDINGSIWNRIIERALNSKPQKNEGTASLHNYISQFNYDPNDEFNGIIKYLTNKTGGNIHDNSTIEVTTNYLDNELPPKNLLDFNDKTYYLATEANDAWICFDFKNYKIKLSKYSIRSYISDANKFHLRNWVVEVSDDKEKWKIIDSKENCETLNGNYLCGTFDVQQYKFSRYIRLRQTGELWGNGRVWFHYIEFYGFLVNAKFYELN